MKLSRPAPTAWRKKKAKEELEAARALLERLKEEKAPGEKLMHAQDRVSRIETKLG